MKPALLALFVLLSRFFKRSLCANDPFPTVSQKRGGVFKGASLYPFALYMGVMLCACHSFVFASKSLPQKEQEKVLPAKRGKISVNKKNTMEMIEIPAGWFLMGSPSGVVQDESQPRHEVYLDRYRISKTEVTVAQFRRYCHEVGYAYRWEENKPSWGYADSYPMVNVTWFEARGYCLWAGGDLPTEAQWEKAARGTGGGAYPWGEAWDAARCVNLENSGRHPASVGSKLSDQSPYGALDMAGNVSEWCRDSYDADYYRRSPKRNPLLRTGDNKVFRGGCWGYHNRDGFFRSDYRFDLEANGWDHTLGFRMAMR